MSRAFILIMSTLCGALIALLFQTCSANAAISHYDITQNTIHYCKSGNFQYITDVCNSFTPEEAVTFLNLDWNDPDGDGKYWIKDATIICDCYAINAPGEGTCYYYVSEPATNRGRIKTRYNPHNWKTVNCVDIAPTNWSFQQFMEDHPNWRQ